MCGIVGYTGVNNALPFLLNGLEKLEYRGYDSAGVYVHTDDNRDVLVKEKGRVKDLEKKVKEYDMQGKSGIAHTRWATHGQPSIENAHPHVSADGRYYLVHNGVIENYKQLKADYLSDVEFKSQTDTEVAVQLVGKFASQGLDTLAAFRKMINLLDDNSSYAFLLMDTKQPDLLYTAKTKSPLLIGISETGNVVASDAPAALDLTKDFIELRDGEIAVVSKNDVQLYDAEGNNYTRQPFHLDIDPTAADKGAYPFFMLKEIDEQAIVTRTLIEHYFVNGLPHIDEKIIQAIKQSDRLYIVAAGTSYHAGLIGRRFFEKWARIPTETHIASEFAYDRPIISKKPFFIFISQSGETADSIQVLDFVQKESYPSLTISNVMNSTLTRESDFALPILAGPEIAVASTKAYTAQIMTQVILAAAIAGGHSELQEELSRLAIDLQAEIDGKEKIKQIADKYLVNANRTFYIGRGADADSTLEAALKLKEISYTLVEGFAAGELKHGTISLIEQATPVIGLISQSKMAGLTRSNLEETMARGAKAVTIVTKNLATKDDDIILPALTGEMEMFGPILEAIPIQLLAYYTSLGRNLDVDHPRNLAKSVTVQ
ncbi:L-glutamine-D-fructose-6-phosphate amidotransferase [Oenococcus oeni]|uniref:glutamine--fructose-6-phosphate transaminase (isomerizing) n=1 Tax=Oenococcus oeni TaxID=1247 RepID=UPI001077491D|nr:glutamine--fructose-6-phosphate transaminase (isomerizing) [Oenococcus oeni]AVI93840.1 glutamine--fructose-6-phosphate aminotransferase [Oenococcus oeni]SYW01758.1 L-glutamine-D-fructose-6-phosphate amidotransferase [Oenococcus oeni]SYW02978.1 L-glutamine-D-fructose-6-phosphate amidotransferase [Oenococcus oeni]SYW04718.1 L-glutamine-D-fructose-6-phosphate amidotransferase [Oenococcus oeni]SYW18204.1 L-glutamine-D-fructose-6-phosphate amidotransferase [Oenococcus oeni]